MSTDQTQTPTPDNIAALPAAAPAVTKPSLTTENAIELSGALVRFDELRNATIATKESEQELSLLGEYIAGKLVTHARDLLGCWFIVHQEYKPLAIALAPIVNRCFDMRRQAVAEEAK